mgnify:CR=1 FL=1
MFLKQLKKLSIKAILLLGLFIHLYSIPAKADLSDIPVVSGAYDLTRVIKDEIVSNVELLAGTTRDVALFSIGGLTLDAYILALPMENDVKARVIAQISNPVYAIRLAHFLYKFVDRYDDEETVVSFETYIKQHYKSTDYPGVQHSLFKWSKPENQGGEKSKEGLAINRELIATFVTIYDALYQNEPVVARDKMPDKYTYLSNNAEDLALVSKVQPLVIKVLKDLHSKMESGDIKDALGIIINDHTEARENTVNNKAQAITVTLIDFIRLNVLKSYRQYRLEQSRVNAFEEWMLDAFDTDQEKLISFLKAQNTRRHAVQITVDGLQGSYLESLATSKSKNFLKQVHDSHQNKQSFRPINEAVSSPEVEPQLDFLNFLIESKQKQAVQDDPRYLPFLKQLYQESSLSISAGGISSTPTISVRNLPLIWTGAGVSGEKSTGIPNFHFVDRLQDRAYYFFGNDALQLDRLVASNQVQTMFDRLNHLKTLNCNAQYDWNAHVSFDGLVNLAVGEVIRDFGERLCIKELRYRAKTEKALKIVRLELIETLEKYQNLPTWRLFSKLAKYWLIKEMIHQVAVKGEKGMPDYLLVYNPWPDHFAHFAGPFSNEVMSPSGELNRLDYWLGLIKKSYQQAGVYNDTLWGMAGDHGLAPIYYYLNPEITVLKNLSELLTQKTGKSLVIKKISSDEGEGPKITNALNYPSNKGVDVVVASTAGGNFMMDFFIDQNNRWQQQPVYRDMFEWKPISFADDDQGLDMITEITSRLRETLDYLVVRESKCDEYQCVLRLVGYRGGVRRDELISRKGERIYYHAITGQPLLLDLDKTNPYKDHLTKQEKDSKQQLYQRCLINAELNNTATWCLESDWRELSYFSPRPDSINQLAHLYDLGRAGTINLFPKEGIGYNTKVPGRHAGEHFHEKDAFIGFWGHPVKTSIQLPPIANGSLAPTLYEYLSGESISDKPSQYQQAGWGFPSVLGHLLQ